LLERGVVYVPGEPLIEKATKTRSKRRLALDARTVELLRTYLSQLQRTGDELGSTLRADAFVFSRKPDGSRPMHPSSMTHRFQEMARPLGLRCRLHDLRHLMITHLISQGVDWRTAAGRAGHAGPHMTLGTYAHFQPAQDRHAADLLAELCDGDGRSVGASAKDGAVLAERQDSAGGK
jgi:integrase